MGTQAVLQWFVQHPLGGVSIVYAAAIIGVLVYTLLEQRLEE